MSRSYRRPYAAITGAHSAKEDKQLAHRGVRRVHNRITKLMVDNPDLVMPHFRSCPWNNTYCWSRDGGKHLQVPTARDWSRHMMAVLELGDRWGLRWNKHYLVWPPKDYIKYTRK